MIAGLFNIPFSTKYIIQRRSEMKQSWPTILQFALRDRDNYENPKDIRCAGRDSNRNRPNTKTFRPRSLVMSKRNYRSAIRNHVPDVFIARWPFYTHGILAERNTCAVLFELLNHLVGKLHRHCFGGCSVQN
jgi:hypothetical protein